MTLARLSSSKYEDHFGQFLGCYETSTTLCFAMEYFALGDLRKHLLNSARFPELDSCAITQQLLSAVATMHDLDISHRDIKPENIFVVEGGPQWRVKLGDFGSSKRLMDQTILQTLVGTRLYMAPEVSHLLDEDDETGAYSCAIDIWSVGVIAFEMLAGQRPFSSDLAVKKYCRGRLHFPNDVLNHVVDGSGSVELIKSLLEPQPADRPNARMAVIDWKKNLGRLKEARTVKPASPSASSHLLADITTTPGDSPTHRRTPLPLIRTPEAVTLLRMTGITSTEESSYITPTHWEDRTQRKVLISPDHREGSRQDHMGLARVAESLSRNRSQATDDLPYQVASADDTKSDKPRMEEDTQHKAADIEQNRDVSTRSTETQLPVDETEIERIIAEIEETSRAEDEREREFMLRRMWGIARYDSRRRKRRVLAEASWWPSSNADVLSISRTG